MLGLMEKDFRLLTQRRTTLFIIVFVALFLSVSMDVSFILGYLCVFGLTLASGTIAYDEYDNGFPFLLSLPIEKKTYVLEKYIFCLLTGLSFWAVAGVLGFVISLARGEAEPVREYLLHVCMFLPAIMLVLAVMLPFLLRFGGERGRAWMLLFCGVLAGLGVLVGKRLSSLPDGLSLLLKKISRIPAGNLLLWCCGFCLLLLWISYLCSRRIMEIKLG